MFFTIEDIRFDLENEEPFFTDSFDRNSIQLFDKIDNDSTLQDRYFSYIASLINGFFQLQLWHKAEQYWERAVHPALQWESNHPGHFIHKGTPYYFWGMAAIARGELDMGYPLMHQSLQEDIRTHNNHTPNTPAFAFATLDFTKIDQAFRIWPQRLADYLNQFLEIYCQTNTKTLNLDEFRNRFLVNYSNLDTIFLFSYTIGKFFLFDRVPEYARENAFTSQLEANIIFDILLVIESAIKVYNQTDRYFPQHALFLSNIANLGLNQHNIQDEVNTAFRNSTNLNIIGDMLDNNFYLDNGTLLTGLARDLGISYGLRNFGAHNILSIPIIQQRFNEIRQSIFNILFLTIEELY